MSFEVSIDPGLPKSEQYAALADQARALLAGETDRVANAANLAALIYAALHEVNWAGFYFFDGTELVVGPFQGLPACVRIPLGQGVCGTAAQERRAKVVADVGAFAGHIACDAASRSEIVLPIILDDELIGVLDVDSPRLGRFDAEDQLGLETLVRLYCESLSGRGQ